jgi:8-oxo-dGTP pyrophosphatase MutT (NUDIX family)
VTPARSGPRPQTALADDDFTRLRDAFTAPEDVTRDGDLPPGASAVLVPLFDTEAGPGLLYTRRSKTLSTHPGEVSFPGGRVDPGDAGPRAAALREAEEEVGIRPRDVDVLGHLTDFITFRGTLVSAYVGHVQAPVPTEPTSPAEVDEMFLVPVQHLLDAERYEGRTLADPEAAAARAPEGSGISARRRDRVVHYWRADPATVWGITGELTARFLEAAYGWAPPKRARVIEDVAEFLP